MARRGKPNITIRMDPDLWAELGEVFPDRSAFFRTVAEWYLRRPGAKFTPRPEAIPRSAEAITDPEPPRSTP